MNNVQKSKDNALATLSGSDAEQFFVFIRFTDGRYYKTAYGSPEFMVLAGAAATHLGIREHMVTEQVLPTLEKQ